MRLAQLGIGRSTGVQERSRNRHPLSGCDLSRARLTRRALAYPRSQRARGWCLDREGRLADRKKRRAQNEAHSRSQARLVWATKLLTVGMGSAFAAVLVSGALNWCGMTPAWLAGIPWVGTVGIVVVGLAVYAFFAAAMAWKHR